ncbi:MAG: hypothetical protein EAX81_02010 [Candidatus Thorarchaeota archaeon]|nr:hypothetical protein [Candidatus Thorarchaeota archaeon]
MDGGVLVFAGGLVSCFFGFSLYLMLESQAESRSTEKTLVIFFIRHATLTEIIIQISAIGGICTSLIISFLTIIDRDPVLAFSFLSLVIVAPLPLAYTIHRRLRHFQDFLFKRTDLEISADIEKLEPVLKARITLVAWLAAIIALIVSFLVYDIEDFFVLSRVLMLLGTGGLIMLSCPALFSIFTFYGIRIKLALKKGVRRAGTRSHLQVYLGPDMHIQRDVRGELRLIRENILARVTPE